MSGDEDPIGGRLLAWALSRGMQDADARDLVQATLLELERRSDAGRSGDDRVRYAFGIARNLRALFVRERARRARGEARRPEAATGGPDPRDEARRLYAEALATLGEADRAIVAMRMRGGPFASIAAGLDMTESAVRQRFVRSIARLRERFLDPDG